MSQHFACNSQLPSIGIAAFFALLAFSPETFAQKNIKAPLKIAISNWAPYKGDDLPEGGIATDITRQILKRAGYKVQIEMVPWQRALNGTISGTYQLTPAIWKTEQRSKALHFTDPILDSRIIAVSLKSYPFTFKRLEDLRGETVGIGRGWAYPEAFMKAAYFTREEATDLKTNINKLLHKRFNIVAAEAFAARYTVNHQFKKQAHLIQYSDATLHKAPLHVAFNRNQLHHETLVARFNQALRAMKQDGTYLKILNKHEVDEGSQLAPTQSKPIKK